MRQDLHIHHELVPMSDDDVSQPFPHAQLEATLAVQDPLVSVVGGEGVHALLDELLTEANPRHGYHKRTIAKGELGKVSKVREELEELEDAIEQGVRIMALLEMADLYGALRALAAEYEVSMKDLEAMDNVTARAFEHGERG